MIMGRWSVVPLSNKKVTKFVLLVSKKALNFFLRFPHVMSQIFKKYSPPIYIKHDNSRLLIVIMLRILCKSWSYLANLFHRYIYLFEIPS